MVIDAIDEFIPPSHLIESSHSDWAYRKALLETLMMLQRDGDGRIKILFTSRPTAEIQSALRDVPRVMISSESNSEDIRLYVRSKLEIEMNNSTDWGERLTEGELQSPTVTSLVVSRLVEKADGM